MAPAAEPSAAMARSGRLGDLLTANKESRIFGALGSVGLDDLVQLLGMNRRTATLVLTRPGEEGRIYFAAGTVVHAFVGDLEGQAAVAELVTWRDAEFVIEEGIPELPRHTLSESATGLMLSTLARIDEQTRDASASHGGTGRIRVRPRGRVTAPVISPPPPQSSRAGLVWTAMVVLLAAAGVGYYFLGERLLGGIDDAVSAAPHTSEPEMASEIPATPSPEATAETEPTPELEPGSEPEGADAEAPPPGSTAPSAPTHGYLVVTADRAADVDLDGRSLGRTPLRRVQLAPGGHTLSLTTDGIAGVLRDRVEIAPGQSLQKSYSFREVGYLQVVVRPWAEVAIDGRPVGQTPMAKLEVVPGQHTVTLTHPEAGERREVVQIRAGETSHVRVTLMETEPE
jgi:Domain of unknown function (DUF4388)/PEGA domain